MWLLNQYVCQGAQQQLIFYNNSFYSEQRAKLTFTSVKIKIKIKIPTNKKPWNRTIPKHFATQPSGFDMCVKVSNKPQEIMLTTNFLCTKTLAAKPNTKQSKTKTYLARKHVPCRERSDCKDFSAMRQLLCTLMYSFIFVQV